MRLAALAATSVVVMSCGGSEGAGEETTTTLEPTWCRTVDDFREDWTALNEAWLAKEITFEEREAAGKALVDGVVDEVPPELREPFEQLMLGELEGVDVGAALTSVLEYEQANCESEATSAEPGDPIDLTAMETDLDRYCALASGDFADFAGGRRQVYEDLVRYAPPEIRAHEVFVVGHLADVANVDVQFDDVDADPSALAPDNVIASIDAIDAFREEHC